MTHDIQLRGFLALLVFSLASRLHAVEAPVASKILAGTFENQAPWVIPLSQSQASLTLKAPGAQTWDFRGVSKLSVKASRDKTSSGSVRLRWLVTSRVGGLYLGPALSLPLSGTAAPAVSFSTDSGELTPVGHQRPWDALAAAEVTALELRAECSANALQAAAVSMEIALSGVKLELGAESSAKPEVLDLSLRAPSAGIRAYVLSFRLNPMPDDPHAVSGPGDVRVKLGDGAGKRALAFLDQDFVEINDGAAERLAPIGLPVWRAYVPEWPASGSFEIVSGKNSWKIPCGAISAERAEAPHENSTAAISGGPDFQAQPKALAHLRWETPLEASAPSLDSHWTGANALWVLNKVGQWAPISEQKYSGLFGTPVSPGTPAAHGPSQDNAPGSVVDLADKKVWRPVPFWNEAWGGYAGARRPDSALARLMDARLAAAAREKEVRPLVLFDGGALERQGVFNWASHPLRGKLAGPGEIFRTEEGFDFCARWMRYCLARYGHSPAVNALLITTDLNAPGASEFHARLAPLLQDWRGETLSGKPMIAFHPLAQPPPISKDIGTFTENSRVTNSNWHVDQRITRAYGQILPREGVGGTGCYELRAMQPTSIAVALEKRYDLEISDWRTPANDNF